MCDGRKGENDTCMQSSECQSGQCYFEKRKRKKTTGSFAATSKPETQMTPAPVIKKEVDPDNFPKVVESPPYVPTDVQGVCRQRSDQGPFDY